MATGFGNAVLGLLVFDASPQTLNEHVVAPSALAIHADGRTPPMPSHEDVMRSAGRVVVDAAIVHNTNGKWFLPGAGGPEMVVVPASTFTMGSPLSEPGRDAAEEQVRVTIDQPFAVGKFAVTFD